MTRTDRGAWLMPVIIAALVAVIVAFMGGTITTLDGWYHGLHQPTWAPPDAAYGIAWTLIYALTALAAVSGWIASPSRRDAEWLIGLLALNGFLNIGWSVLFFRLHRPDWAAIESVGLWLSVLALVLTTKRWSRTAPLLLLPYLAWVTFAFTLDLAIVRLNGPFA